VVNRKKKGGQSGQPKPQQQSQSRPEPTAGPSAPPGVHPDPQKEQHTGESGGQKQYSEAHKQDNPLHEWSDHEIRFHAVGVRKALTSEEWRPMGTLLKAAHAIWSNAYHAQHPQEDRNGIKINNPTWDKALGCGVITLPEGVVPTSTSGPAASLSERGYECTSGQDHHAG